MKEVFPSSTSFAGPLSARFSDLAGWSDDVRSLGDIVAKVFLGGRTKFLRAADAFYERRREGPYRFIQNRPGTSIVALKSDTAAEKSKDQLSRDFSGRSIFDFCNSISTKGTAMDRRRTSADFPSLLLDYARLRDLTIIPVAESYEQIYPEAVIFGSGKPTMVLPKTLRTRPFELGTVAVAWDFSRAAARAISDALPLLEKARKVRVVTIVDEKHMDTEHSAEELAKNLARHGIDVVLDRVEAKSKPIGSVLESYTLSNAVDLLVMGAYGHSRLRQFILGGATKSLLSKPPLPILFSH